MGTLTHPYLEDPAVIAGRYWTTTDQPRLLRWAARRCGIDGGWLADSEAIGATDGPDGPLRIVGVLNGFHDQGAQVHVATSGAAPRPLLACVAPLFDYAFRVRGLARVTARIAVGNVAAQMVALRLGFSVEGRERAGRDGQDMAVFGLLRAEAGWLEKEVPDGGR